MKRKKVTALLLTMSLTTLSAATAITGCGAFAGTEQSQKTASEKPVSENKADDYQMKLDEEKESVVPNVDEAVKELEEAKLALATDETSEKNDMTDDQTLDKESKKTEDSIKPSVDSGKKEKPSVPNTPKPVAPNKNSETSQDKKPGNSAKPEGNAAADNEVIHQKPEQPAEDEKPEISDDAENSPESADDETNSPDRPTERPENPDNEEVPDDEESNVTPEIPSGDNNEGPSEVPGEDEMPGEDKPETTPEDPDVEIPGTDDQQPESPEEDGSDDEVVDDDKPAHVHEWTDHVITVEVEEVGHYEEVVTTPAWTETINHPEESHIEYVEHPEEFHYEQKWVYQCHGCKNKFYSYEDISKHVEDQMIAGHFECGGYSEFKENVKVVDKEAWTEEIKVVDKEAWTEYIEHEAEYEQVWVVDQEAHTETVVDGQICAGCGEWKES